ncbi:MAG: PAC2 family protein, partial [Candidatus Bathyarchaeia archaeon]
MYERPNLNNPILIEGLPGIGLVANITVAYLIKKLNAKLFCEIK